MFLGEFFILNLNFWFGAIYKIKKVNFIYGSMKSIVHHYLSRSPWDKNFYSSFVIPWKRRTHSYSGAVFQNRVPSLYSAEDKKVARKHRLNRVVLVIRLKVQKPSLSYILFYVLLTNFPFSFITFKKFMLYI